MHSFLSRCLTAAILVCLTAGTVAAQQPDASQIQSAIQKSGLTLEQVRSRLKAQGYSEKLLDSYYTGSPTGTPSDEVFSAVKMLGITDTIPAVDTTAKGGGADVRKLPRGVDRDFLDTVAAAAKDDNVKAAILSLLHSRDARQSQLDSGLTIFGLDAFRRETSLFDANQAGPVPPDYVITPGDELVLVLTGDIEHSYDLPVTREGMIFIPNVGAVPVANLSIQQLNDVLYNRLSRVYSGIGRGANATAHFQVTVARLGNSQVSVLGDVMTPGSYTISKLGTVLTALYAAGGPSTNGSLRRVEVRRGGKLVATPDLYDYLISGTTTGDVRLENGDVVLVPPHGPRVRLSGAVLRASTYELKSGETLGDLVRMAGGFRPEADRRRVQIERLVPPAKRTVAGNDRELFDVAGASLEASREPLLDGDVIHVGTVAARVANSVKVLGNVWSPGPIALTPGMTLSQALARAGGVKSDTYSDALQVARLYPDSTRRIVRIPVPGMNDPRPGDDITLQSDDEIRVFSLSEYRPARYVNIVGAVGKPGRYPYREGMTIRDLLMVSGGLKEGALLTEAEVARMPADREAGTTAITIRAPLDSTYLFDRRPGSTYQGPPGVAAPAHSAQEFELKPYDNVLILRQPDWMLPRSVVVKGEVRYPGEYTLRSKSERLSDVISRAGGLTRYAYPEGIVFTRVENSVGRIGVDLPAVLKNRNDTDNLLLADGDTIEIPFHSATVIVKGQVNSPVAVPFVAGADIDYYIYAAGGATAKADASKAFVTQPSGKVESRRRRVFFVSKPEPQPGSTVMVPASLDNNHFDIAASLTALTSILTSAIALAAILRH